MQMFAEGLTLGVICGFLIYIHQQEIKDAIREIYTVISDAVTCSVTVNPEQNPQCLHAIKEELSQQTENKHIEALDGHDKLLYRLRSGKYTLDDERFGKFYVDIQDKKITLTSLGGNIQNIKDYLNEIYESHCSSDSALFFYLSGTSDWGIPIFRRPRAIPDTPDMQLVLDDVNAFIRMECEYQHTGEPYRRGYLLHGDPGTGKSRTIEAVAIEHNMSIHELNLNAREMTDSLLIRLVGNLPPRSILTIEEIDEQLQVLNQNRYLTLAGLLTALDGPQRLSHGTLVFATTSNDQFVTQHSTGTNALFRQGRIDVKFKFGSFQTV